MKRLAIFLTLLAALVVVAPAQAQSLDPSKFVLVDDDCSAETAPGENFYCISVADDNVYKSAANGSFSVAISSSTSVDTAQAIDQDGDGTKEVYTDGTWVKFDSNDDGTCDIAYNTTSLDTNCDGVADIALSDLMSKADYDIDDNGAVDAADNATSLGGTAAANFPIKAQNETIFGDWTFNGALIGTLTGNASTASALAANPTDCLAGQFATGIDAAGNLTCSTPSGSGDMTKAVYDTDNDSTVDTAEALASNPTDCTGGQYATAIDAAGNLTCSIPGGSGDMTKAVYDTDGDDTVDLAEQATALAANPTDCAANQFADAIDASGNLTCAGIVDADVPNDITVNNAGTADALSSNPTDCGANQFAEAIDASGNLACSTLTDADIPDDITVDDATSAGEVDADNDGTPEVAVNGVSNTVEFDPDDDDVVESQINSDGSFSGNSATASALASDPTDCSANQFANGIAANGNLSCSALTDADVPNDITVDNATEAASGDSATGFFPAGTIEHERGGLEANVSAYTGLVAIAAGSTSEVDSKSELEGQLADVSDLAEADGDTYSGAHDYGGATSVEVPNGANPTTDAEGEVAYDTDDDALEVYDGSASRLIPTKMTAQMTVFDPDTIQTTSDALPMLAVEADWAPHGITIVDCGIKTDSSSTYSLNFEEWTSPSDGSPSTIETVATSTSYEASDDGTLSDASIAAGSIIYIDLPATDVNTLQVWFTYYINDGN